MWDQSVQAVPLLTCSHALAGISTTAGGGFFYWCSMPRSKPLPGLPEQLVNFVFPSQGLDLTAEFELQRQGTTPVGQNVRFFESLTQRGRGGSRPGIAQYVPQQVSGSNLIQHLNYIVDPQADALGTTQDPLDGYSPGIGVGFGFQPYNDVQPGLIFPQVLPGTPNPGLPGEGTGGFEMPNGFWTRTGGNGIQPNANVGTLPPQPSIIVFVGATSGASSPFAGNTIVLTLSGVQAGDFLFVVANTANDTQSPSDWGNVSLSDNLGSVWSQAGTMLRSVVPTDFSGHSMWWAAAGGTGTLTLTVSPKYSGSGVGGCGVVQYRNQHTGDPTDQLAVNSASIRDATWTTGTMTPGHGRELALGFFVPNLDLALTPGLHLNVRLSSQGSSSYWPIVVDSLSATFPLAMTIGWASNFIGGSYVAGGLTIRNNVDA